MSRAQQYPRHRCPRCRRDRLSDASHVYCHRVVRRSRASVLLECELCHYRWRSRNAIALSGDGGEA